MNRFLTLFFITLLILIISACSGGNNENAQQNNQNSNNETTEQNEEKSIFDDDSTEDELTVTLNDVDGNKAAEATLSNVDDGVNVKLVGDGLPEEKAKHGFHVHEKGICEPKDFESAGGHYNPLNKNHGKEDKDGQHAGDFDNIEVDADGEVDVEFTTDQISLDKDATNTVFSEDGTSLIIHEDPDDYKSQPSGDAGDRIACGVIAEPE